MAALRPHDRGVIYAMSLAAVLVLALTPQARAEEPKPAEQKPDPALEAQLDRRLPEINFNGVALSDVIDFLRDVTGANISVQWGVLETAGIKKDTPVTTRLRDAKFRTVLKVILDELGNGKVKLGWTLHDNVIVISTVEEAKPKP